MKKTKPTEPDAIRKYEPDGIDIFGGGMPKTFIDQRRKILARSSIHYDNLFFCYLLIAVVFSLMLIMLSVHASRMAFIQGEILNLQALTVSAETAPTSEVAPASTSPEDSSAPESASQGLFIPAEASAFKTWMDYRTIAGRTSEQWKLQQLCDTNAQGFRTYDGCYLVAVGSFYSSNRIGKRLVITFDTGESIQAIVGDVKRDEDVINGQYHKSNGNLIEFIVDKEIMDPAVLLSGDVSSLGLEGKVIEILEVG